MAQFTYNNTKNDSIGYIFFELNCKYHFGAFYKKNFDFYSKLKAIKELFFKL